MSPTDLTERWSSPDGGDRRVRRCRRRLEVDDVAVTFGGLRALDGVSLTAEPGTIVGLIGPNGSGKTTLLDAVSGIVDLGRGIDPPRR